MTSYLHSSDTTAPSGSTPGASTASSRALLAMGITNPPIDELLTRSDSKYKLVLFAAKRARQINAYYSQLGEGLLDHVGPLVETSVQEKPLSIALREVNAGKLSCTDIDPEAEDTQADSGSAYEPA